MAQEIPQEQRTWGLIAHLSALAGYVIPFGNIVGPLVIWLVKRDEWPFVADQAKESLNFQISMTIYMIVAGILILVAIGVVLLPLLGVLNLVAIIVAAIKANEGKQFRYPACIRFIK